MGDIERKKIVKRGAGTVKQCPVCGKDYFASFSKLNHGRAKFCSVRCSMIGRPRPEWTGAKNPVWKGGRKEGKAEEAKRYRTANPHKSRAREEVRKAIKRGELSVQPCEICGSTDKIHAHHEDYARPLHVKWLCAQHHIEAHGGTVGGKTRKRKYTL